jgi:hypothetical protein
MDGRAGVADGRLGDLPDVFTSERTPLRPDTSSGLFLDPGVFLSMNGRTEVSPA